MRRGAVFLGALAFATSASACIALEGFDGGGGESTPDAAGEGGADGSGSGSSNDGAAPGTSSDGGAGDGAGSADDAGGGDAAVEGGVVTIFDDDFESRIDCDGWSVSGTGTPKAPGHASARACEICGDANGGQIVKGMPDKGPGVYVLDGYAMNETAPTPSAVTVQIFDGNHGYLGGNNFAFGATWVPIQSSMDFTGGVPAAGVLLYLNGPPNSCFFLDDLVLRYQP